MFRPPSTLWFDQPSTPSSLSLRTHVSFLSFLFPHLFISLLHFPQSLSCIYDSSFSHRSFSLSLSFISLIYLLYLPLFTASVFQLLCCTYAPNLLQHSRRMLEQKFGGFYHSICPRFSLFIVTNWQMPHYSIIDTVRWTIDKNKLFASEAIMYFSIYKKSTVI